MRRRGTPATAGRPPAGRGRPGSRTADHHHHGVATLMIDPTLLPVAAKRLSATGTGRLPLRPSDLRVALLGEPAGRDGSNATERPQPRRHGTR